MSVRTVTAGDRRIVLVGTAHVSRTSAREVEEVIRAEKPDRVCVELDEARYRTLTDEKGWRELNVGKVLREGKGLFMLANLVLGSFQRRIGAELGVKQGAEMLAALSAADEMGIPFEFADRDIQVTLRRAWAKTGLWGKLKMLSAMLSSVFTRAKFGEEEIERLKERNALEEMMQELSAFLPQAKEVLIDERDRYLATKIYAAEGRTVVAVVGAGHLQGIESTIRRLASGELSEDVSDLEVVPPRGLVSRILPWSVPAVIVGLFVAGFFRSGVELSLRMLWKWVLINGTLSAIGSLAALAHPVTILAAFLAAPVTSMNPTIGVGIVTGIVEAAMRKPLVSDFENLTEDTTSLRGFFRNRFTHILVVFFLSSVGSSIGTFVAIPYLSRMLW